ncbi:MAG: zinc-ribbon domain containing protein [Anaerolineae bacterium]|nr:zinc-ribbon domain containing protein [Anaerolineae bacterium]
MTYRNDETLQCLDCGRLIAWSYSKQRHFKEKGWPPPKYCRVCKGKRDDYHRSSQRDHPSPVVPDVLPKKQPRIDATSLRKPIIEKPKRPSWWANPLNRINALLLFLVVLAAVVLIMLFLEMY